VLPVCRRFCFIFAPGNFTPGVVRIMVRISVVYVDSAVRWRRNDVVGKENRCSFAVV
jgi:hypothetical protein